MSDAARATAPSSRKERKYRTVNPPKKRTNHRVTESTEEDTEGERRLRLLLSSLSLRAQEGQLDKSEPKGITPEEIIQRFASKEKEFKQARDQYTYRQSVKVQTLDGDTVDGEYQQVFDVTFDDKSRKVKNVVFAPQSSTL